MQRLQFLFRNITLLNLILIIAVILIANYAVLPLFDMKVKYTLAAPKKVSPTKVEEPQQVQIPSPSDYTIIAELNLFHPERKIPPEKDEKLLPKPEFVLYGTLITDDLSLAYMEDKKSPRNTPGRGKRQTVLRVGQTMSGYTLKEIDVDKVVMVRGEETIIVKVIDHDVKKDREGQAPAPKAPEPVVKRPPPPPATTPPTRPEQPVTPKKAPYRPPRTQ